MDSELREEIRVAIAKCDEFKHTNAVPAMKALALKPREIKRDEAMNFW